MNFKPWFISYWDLIFSINVYVDQYKDKASASITNRSKFSRHWSFINDSFFTSFIFFCNIKGYYNTFLRTNITSIDMFRNMISFKISQSHQKRFIFNSFLQKHRLKYSFALYRLSIIISWSTNQQLRSPAVTVGASCLIDHDAEVSENDLLEFP